MAAVVLGVGSTGAVRSTGLRTSQTSRVRQEWLHLAVNQRTGCQTGREAQHRADAEKGEGEQSVSHECCACVWSKGYFRLARWQARWELVGQLQAGWSHEESYCGKRDSVVSLNHFRQVLSQLTVWWLWCKGQMEGGERVGNRREPGAMILWEAQGAPGKADGGRRKGGLDALATDRWQHGRSCHLLDDVTAEVALVSRSEGLTTSAQKCAGFAFPALYSLEFKMFFFRWTWIFSPHESSPLTTS